MLAVAISRSLAPPSLHRAIDGSCGIDPAMFSPSEVLRRLDREFQIERFDKFFTICYLVLNHRTGEFRYSRARDIQYRWWCARVGGLELLEAGGTIIGIGTPMPFDEGSGRLEQGDMIVLYTDGVTEGQNSNGDFFGEDKLYRALFASAGASPESACRKVMNDLFEFSDGARSRDDVTVMAIRYEDWASERCASANFEAGPCI